MDNESDEPSDTLYRSGGWPSQAPMGIENMLASPDIGGTLSPEDRLLKNMSLKESGITKSCIEHYENFV